MVGFSVLARRWNKGPTLTYDMALIAPVGATEHQPSILIRTWYSKRHGSDESIWTDKFSKNAEKFLEVCKERIAKANIQVGSTDCPHAQMKDFGGDGSHTWILKAINKVPSLHKTYNWFEAMNMAAEISDEFGREILSKALLTRVSEIERANHAPHTFPISDSSAISEYDAPLRHVDSHKPSEPDYSGISDYGSWA